MKSLKKIPRRAALLWNSNRVLLICSGDRAISRSDTELNAKLDFFVCMSSLGFTLRDFLVESLRLTLLMAVDFCSLYWFSTIHPVVVCIRFQVLANWEELSQRVLDNCSGLDCI